MMKLAFLTDLHLNFLEKQERIEFYQTVIESSVDIVLISGDTAEAPSIHEILVEMKKAIDKPIYFVLGNHDFYRSSIRDVRENMAYLTKEVEGLFWLKSLGSQKLTEDIVLVGTDGFADGRYGNYEKSTVSVNDSYLIAELYQEKLYSKTKVLLKMQQLADEDAQQLYRDIEIGVNRHYPKKIIVLTHVPPFPEVCLYEGRQSDDAYLPYFASKAIGDVLLLVAKKYPSIEFIVLCGHTHHYAKEHVFSNLNVTVGEAHYYKPKIQDIIVL